MPEEPFDNNQPQLQPEDKSISKESINSQPSKFEMMLSNVIDYGTLEDLEHILLHFPAYLNEIKDLNELKSVLTCYLFLNKKLELTDVYELLNDFDGPNNQVLVIQLNKALTLSANILNQRKDQLPIQLRGRLVSSDNTEIQEFLSQVNSRENRIWLKPINGFKEDTRNGLNQTFEGGLQRDASVNTKTHLLESNDGKYFIAPGKRRGTIAIWEASSGKYVHVLRGHSEIKEIQLSHNNTDIISIGEEGLIKVWGIHSGNTELVIGGQRSEQVLETKDLQHLIVGGFKILQVRDRISGEIIHELNGHEGSISKLIETRDGKRIISKSLNSVKVWDRFTGEQIHTFESQASIDSVIESHDGQFIITGGTEHQTPEYPRPPRSTRVWNAATGELVSFGFGSFPRESRDGNSIFSSVSDMHFSSYNKLNKLTGEVIQRFQGGRLYETEDGYVLTIQDSEINVYDQDSGNLFRTLKHENYTYILGVLESKDGKSLISAVRGARSEVVIWDKSTWDRIASISYQGRDIVSFRESTDGLRIVLTYIDGTIKIWDKSSNEESLKIHHTSWIEGLVKTMSGKSIISHSSNFVKIWSTDSASLLATFNNGRSSDSVIESGYEDIILIFQSMNIQAIDRLSGELLYTRGTESTDIICDKGTAVITKRLKWDIATGETIFWFDNHNTPYILGVFESYENESIVTYDESVINVWDSKTGTLLLTINNGDFFNRFENVVASANSKRIISISRDNLMESQDTTIMVWDISFDNPSSTTEEITIGDETSNVNSRLMYSFKQEEEVEQVIQGKGESSIISITKNNVITLWDGQSEKIVSSFDPGEDIKEVKAISTSKLLIGYKTNRLTEIFDINTKTVMLSLQNNRYLIDEDTSTIIYRDRSGVFSLNLSTNETTTLFEDQAKNIGSIVESIHPSLFIFQTSDSVTYIMNKFTGEIVSKLDFSGEFIESIDGKFVISMKERIIKVFDKQQGGKEISSVITNSFIRKIEYIEDANTLVAGCTNGEVLFFKLENVSSNQASIKEM